MMKEIDIKIIGLAITLFFTCLGCILVLGTSGFTEAIGLAMLVIGLILSVISIVVSYVTIHNDIVKTLIVISVNIILFLVCSLISSPLYHGVLLGIYTNPFVLEALIIAFIISISTILLLKKNNDNPIFVLISIFIFSLVISLIVLSLFTGYASCSIVEEYDVTEIFELPEMDQDYLRITPKKVALRYMSDASQYPRHKPYSPCDLILINGTPYWSTVLSPDGIFNYYNIKDVGSIYVDMSTMDKKVEIKEQTLDTSPGIGLKDNDVWRILTEHKYYIDLERPMIFLYENSTYIMRPYIEYEHKFTFPLWYTIPKWGGVFLIDEEGNIQDLSPNEARESEILKGQKLFPEKLATFYVESQNYWKAETEGFLSAIFNLIFNHDEQIEIIDVSDQGNEQPFLINTNNGLKWTISVEPYGNAHGIYRIYLLDSRTGNMEYMQFSGKEIGPVRACDYVRKDNPIVDWDRFDVIEPIPVLPNGELYWEIRVSSNDGSGISYVAFVHPITGNVIRCESDVQVRDFIYSMNITGSTEENATINGVISNIETFIYNGYTNWVIQLENKSGYYNANSNDLTYTDCSILTLKNVGDTISFTTQMENQQYIEDVID